MDEHSEEPVEADWESVEHPQQSSDRAPQSLHPLDSVSGCPLIVRCAGAVWVLLGAVYLLGFCDDRIARMSAQFHGSGLLQPQVAALIWLGVVLAVGVLVAGLSVACGIVRDTKWVSLVLGLMGFLTLVFGAGMLIWGIATAPQAFDRTADFSRVTDGTAVAVLGVGFLAAASLALIGRGRYRLWRTGRARSRFAALHEATVVLCGLLAGGYAWYDRQPEWHKLASAKGEFEIDLPAEPRADMAILNEGRRHATLMFEGTVLPAFSEEYLITYHHSQATTLVLAPPRFRPNIRPYPNTGNPWAHLQPILESLGENRDVSRVKLGSSTTIFRRAAMEAELEFKDGRVGLALVVDSHQYVYLLTACGPPSEAGMARYRRFIKSFQLPRLDP